MTDWSNAACIGQLDLFFDESPTSVELAKSICLECPLRSPCLTGALQRGEAYGIWGGSDFQERQIVAVLLGYPIPRRKPEVEHGTSRGYAWHQREKSPIDIDENGIDVCGCRTAYLHSAKERTARYRKRKREARGNSQP